MVFEGETSKAARVFLVLVVGSLVVAFLPLRASAQVYPTVTIEVVRIQEIDAIDLFGGDWDWFFWIGDFSSTWTWTRHEAPNGQDVTFSIQQGLSVRQTTVTIAITLCEGDTFSNDDVADISSNSDSGYDDSGSNCTPSGSPFAGSFTGIWDLVSDTLSGDTTVSDPQGLRASGDFDGSTGTDVNDANLWFRISDNYGPPAASAGPDKSGSTGSTLSFDGSSSAASAGSSIEFYEWDFTGDLAPDLTGPIVSWTFNVKGVYTVTLTVRDSIGVTDTDSAIVTIQNRAPTAAFAFSPAAPTVRDIVTFADTSTDPDGTIGGWIWDFGDGTTSTLPNPTHRFAANGPKGVVLTVTDNDGSTASVSHTVTVTNLNPQADFAFQPSSVITGEVVRFTDASTDEDGSVTSWDWDFGDGSSAATRNPSHTYDSAGTYQVSLTVTDNDGAEHTVTVSVTVAQAPLGGRVAGIPTVALLVPILIIAILLAAVLRWRKKKSNGPPPGPT